MPANTFTVGYITEGPGYGWDSAPILACFAVAAAGLAVFGWSGPGRAASLITGAADPVPARAA